MSSADTGPSAANSTSSTRAAGADTRWPAARSVARMSSAEEKSSGGPLGRPRHGRRIAGAPALLDAPVAPDRERERPGQHEQADHEIADEVEVDVADDVEHAEQLDRADHERDRDRQPGDGDVVEELADRLRERPAVGEVHERAVDRVEQRHAGREQDRQAEDRVERQPARRRAAGQDEQPDLGRGVEAEPEQAAERIHVPRLADRPRRAPEHAVHAARASRAARSSSASSSSPARDRARSARR